MTTLILMLLIALAMAVGTVRLVLHDGRGPSGPPRSHLDDRQFRSPGASPACEPQAIGGRVTR